MAACFLFDTDERLRASVLALAVIVVGDQTLDETRAQVAALAADAVPGADRAAITPLADDAARASIPLAINHTSGGGASVGVLNLYGAEPGALDETDRTIAAEFAAVAAVTVANAQACWEARALGEQLQEAMRSRAAIEQAKGIIMCREGCDPDQAFQALVTTSQHENRKVRALAEELVAGAQKPA